MTVFLVLQHVWIVEKCLLPLAVIKNQLYGFYFQDDYIWPSSTDSILLTTWLATLKGSGDDCGQYADQNYAPVDNAGKTHDCQKFFMHRSFPFCTWSPIANSDASVSTMNLPVFVGIVSTGALHRAHFNLSKASWCSCSHWDLFFSCKPVDWCRSFCKTFNKISMIVGKSTKTLLLFGTIRNLPFLHGIQKMLTNFHAISSYCSAKTLHFRSKQITRFCF